MISTAHSAACTRIPPPPGRWRSGAPVRPGWEAGLPAFQGALPAQPKRRVNAVVGRSCRGRRSEVGTLGLPRGSRVRRASRGGSFPRRARNGRGHVSTRAARTGRRGRSLCSSPWAPSFVALGQVAQGLQSGVLAAAGSWSGEHPTDVKRGSNSCLAHGA